MHPPDYCSAHLQHTAIGACGTQWGYAVVLEEYLLFKDGSCLLRDNLFISRFIH